ncbi:MAG TPA: hypothetical protein PLS53_10915 [Thermoanaerobaculaceae bacterium]|nr:hypothetical protein [Thermoanaerobaculaceae bacterium]
MDSTALIPALRRSAFLKQSADLLRGLGTVAKHTVPAAGAVTAVGAGTDWDPAAMTAAGAGTYALGHPLAGLAQRGANRLASGAKTKATQANLAHSRLNTNVTTPVQPHVHDPLKTQAENVADRSRAQIQTDAQNQAKAQLSGARRDAAAATQRADTTSEVAKGVSTVAPVAAAGIGTAAGMTDTGQAVGDKINTGTAAAGTAVKSTFTGDPKTDWLQVAKDYAPAILGVGAAGALALWLMSRDDENQEKTAAVPVDDDLAFAARNRRRLEGLLARNPKALDNIGKHEVQGALDALPVQLDAVQRTKLASFLCPN